MPSELLHFVPHASQECLLIYLSGNSAEQLRLRMAAVLRNFLGPLSPL